jgi:hypothetical protein
MKTLKFNTTINTLMSVLVTAIVLMGCSKDADVPTPSSYPSSDGSSKTLTAAELQDLNYMVEKEKLMRNVYEALYDDHQLEIFDTYAGNKERHMNLLAVRLHKYDMENTTVNLPYGEFNNSSLQQTYNSFIASGQRSLAAAINYTQAMEENHVVIVEQSIAALDGNSDILSIYNMILSDSENYLDLVLDFSKSLNHLKSPFPIVREL